MNGIHDLGGMHGLGAIPYERDETMFHAPWEGRVQALATALSVYGKWRSLRVKIEAIPPADYLRMSYYELRIEALVESLVETGMVTRAEIEQGRADPVAERTVPALAAAAAADYPLRPPSSELDADVIAGFRVGQRVRSRDLNPMTHTRQPRYTRGRVGIVERDRGVFALPDNEIYFLDPKPQHVYLVRFTARELWGEAAPARDSLYIDLWEDYLEPA